MLRPVGSQPPSVYWRRRLLLVGSAVIVIVLLVVTVRALTSDGGGGSTTAGGSGSPSATAAGPTTRTSSSPPRTSASARPSSSSRSRPKSPSGSSSAPSTAAPATCRTADLAVSAVVAAPNYKVGAMPMLEMQVTNNGKAPCVQDLADKQIVLKVYNGESRVWGSHDCEVQSGTALRTLAVNASVRVTITWSGLTSQPSNCSSRQRVGAGTYTLYATLAGKTGKAAQFTIS